MNDEKLTEFLSARVSKQQKKILQDFIKANNCTVSTLLQVICVQIAQNELTISRDEIEAQHQHVATLLANKKRSPGRPRKKQAA